LLPRGKTIARISDEGGERARVIAPQDGRVLEIRVTEGSVINAGSPILSLGPPRPHQHRAGGGGLCAGHRGQKDSP
jgi:multidrug efflux pump subunit AcrA (membrane-fusion protein)